MLELPDHEATREVPAVVPSDTASARLAHELSREVGDLRVQAEERLLRSDFLLRTGRTEEAAAVLDEQRELLVAFARRTARALAAASVEREAEGVLAAASGVQVLHDTPSIDEEPGVITRLRLAWSDGRDRLQAAATAAVTAAAAAGFVAISGGAPSVSVETPDPIGPRSVAGTASEAALSDVGDVADPEWAAQMEAVRPSSLLSAGPTGFRSAPDAGANSDEVGDLIGPKDSTPDLLALLKAEILATTDAVVSAVEDLTGHPAAELARTSPDAESKDGPGGSSPTHATPTDGGSSSTEARSADDGEGSSSAAGTPRTNDPGTGGSPDQGGHTEDAPQPAPSPDASDPGTPTASTDGSEAEASSSAGSADAAGGSAGDGSSAETSGSSPSAGTSSTEAEAETEAEQGSGATTDPGSGSTSASEPGSGSGSATSGEEPSSSGSSGTVPSGSVSGGGSTSGGGLGSA